MKFSTSSFFAACALVGGTLAAVTAHAQDSHFVAASEPSHKQPTEISFAGAPTTDINDILVVRPVNLSAVPAPEEGASFYDDSRKDLSQSLGLDTGPQRGRPYLLESLHGIAHSLENERLRRR